MARQGKIARLPQAVREQLNTRLLQGEPAAKILPWLNALDETKKVLAEFFSNESDPPLSPLPPVKTSSSPVKITDQNLSEWRKGGFMDWLKRRDRLDHTRELAQYSVKLAKANGGSIADGAIAIASGYILELLEACDGTLDPETAGELINGLAKLQASDAAKTRTGLDREKLKRLDQQIALEREKFQRQTGELYLKMRAEERKQLETIADGTGTQEEKIERLGQILFPLHWQSKKDQPA